MVSHKDSNPPPPHDDEGVDVREKKTVFSGYFKVDRYLLRHRLHEGGWSREISREIFERGHAAALLPYDPKRDEVVLIEQFRAGALAARRHPWLIEVVAGIIEPGELAETVARRETREEAGLEVGRLVAVSDYLVSPGGTSETMALFCGEVDSTHARGIHGHDHEDEDIRVLALPFAQADEWVRSGKIANGTALVALLWLALNREKLRRDWGA